jgi:sulfate adenylyltransferase subunit 2
MNRRDHRSSLRQLDAEAIFSLREAVAEFRNRVMLYSVGKDLGAMLRIAQKAFFPDRLSAADSRLRANEWSGGDG